MVIVAAVRIRDTGDDSENDNQVDYAVQYRRYYCSYFGPRYKTEDSDG
jgi:hypothetical protein